MMRTALKIAVSAALVALIAWRLDVRLIAQSIAGYRAPYMLAAAALFTVAFLLAVVRWRLFVPEIRFAALLRLSLIGLFYSIVLPGQLAGEAIKAYRLAKGTTQVARLAGSVLIDRVVGTLSLLVLGDIGYLLSGSRVPGIIGHALMLLTVGLGGALLVLRIPAVHALALQLPDALRAAGPRLGKLAGPVGKAIAVWHDYSAAPVRLLCAFAIGLVIQALGVLLHMALGADLAIHVPAADWCWIVAVVGVAVLVPLSVAGIGLREGALIGCLALMGIDGERAVALSLGVFALAIAAALVGWIAEVTGRPASR